MKKVITSIIGILAMFAVTASAGDHPSKDEIVKAKATYTGTLKQKSGGTDWPCTATLSKEDEVKVKWSTGDVTYTGKMGPSGGKEGNVIAMNGEGSDKSQVRFEWISATELKVEWWPNMAAKAGQKQHNPAHVSGTIKVKK